MANAPKCPACKRAYQSKLGCAFSHVVFDDKQEMERQRVEFVVDGRCPDCGAPDGKVHHEGCDQERCPKCGLQMLGCVGGEFDGEKIQGEWGHTIVSFKGPAPKPRKRRIELVYGIDEDHGRVHVVILKGSRHLKDKTTEWMGEGTRQYLTDTFDGWRAAGIEVATEEKAWAEMVALEEEMHPELRRYRERQARQKVVAR